MCQHTGPAFPFPFPSHSELNAVHDFYVNLDDTAIHLLLRYRVRDSTTLSARPHDTIHLFSAGCKTSYVPDIAMSNIAESKA
jgi:hypothetical protein